ncbi:MarR family winged helix-turn-helix transcriptional regulator [Spirochaeta dissipatitropha]
MQNHEAHVPRNELFARLFATANHLQTIGDRHLDGVTTKQWFLIACVGRFEPEQPSLSDLVPVVGSSRQNIKQLALKLEQRGFLSINKDPRDNRIIRLSQTDYCRTYWSERRSMDMEFLDRLFSGINPESIHRSLETLRALDQNIQKLRGENGK